MGWGKRYWLLTAVALATAGCSGQDGGGDDSADWRPSYPDTPFPKIEVSTDPETIARGEYLVDAVAHCASCHLPAESVAFAAPEAVRQLLPTGGREWSMGPDITIRSPNITPHSEAGVGNWTDAELARAIKSGIDREGRPIIFMNGLGYYDDRDVGAIVSYLRSIQPVGKQQAPTEITPAGQEMLRTEMPGFLLPRAQVPVAFAPMGETSIARGEYLANGPARCIQCHSNVQAAPTVFAEGPLLSGGQWPDADPTDPAMEFNAPNLTPSKEYGHMAGWSEDSFVARFRAGRVFEGSEMPWDNYKLMSESDLRSLYRYLMSLEPAEIDPGPTYRERGWKP